MAVIICPECNNNMSDTLEACPHCGYKIKNLNSNEHTAKTTANHSVCTNCGKTYYIGANKCPYCKTKNQNKKSSSITAAIATVIIAIIVFALFNSDNTNKQTSADSNKKIYTIGDRGPGGGWIFYDKGNSKDGWRYLEAASEDIKGKINWSNDKLLKVGITSRTVGSGKQNTSKILKVLGISSSAAKLCSEYNGGNKNDWFLPSKDELNLMYKNLHLKSLGNFSNDVVYWSSTEYNFERAWLQDFDSGMQDQGIKNLYDEPLTDMAADTFVRAVRAF